MVSFEPVSACIRSLLISEHLAPVRSYIEKDVQTFTGTAVFEGPGVAYREYVPGIKQYIGDSPEVDANWHELVRLTISCLSMYVLTYVCRSMIATSGSAKKRPNGIGRYTIRNTITLQNWVGLLDWTCSILYTVL